MFASRARRLLASTIVKTKVMNLDDLDDFFESAGIRQEYRDFLEIPDPDNNGDLIGLWPVFTVEDDTELFFKKVKR